MPTETAEHFACRREEEELALALASADVATREKHLARAADFRAQQEAMTKSKSA